MTTREADLPAVRACPTCLARCWLLERLAGHLDRVGDRIELLLALTDDELIEAVGGRQAELVRTELEAFDPVAAGARCVAAGLEAVCRCDRAYPSTLLALPAPPAVLHVAGGLVRLGSLVEERAVAIVGSRRASPYGLDVARSLGRGLSVAGVTVISGMAAGIDSAAHEGALDVGAATVAVLPSRPERAYPASARVLHRRIRAVGVVISELGPGVSPRRWMFPARNRIIAGLSAMTVVVAARRESGALLTARAAAEIGRAVGAVPGQVTAPLSAGPHQLLRAGAELIAGPQDVFAALFGSGGRPPHDPGSGPSLEPQLHRLLDALADGHDTERCFELVEMDPDRGLAALASLELAGLICRQPGGRFLAVSGSD